MENSILLKILISTLCAGGCKNKKKKNGACNGGSRSVHKEILRGLSRVSIAPRLRGTDASFILNLGRNGTSADAEPAGGVEGVKGRRGGAAADFAGVSNRIRLMMIIIIIIMVIMDGTETGRVEPESIPNGELSRPCPCHGVV